MKDKSKLNLMLDLFETKLPKLLYLQVLRERDQFKEKYWALKREYGALEAKRNQKSKILKFFLSIFKRSPQDETVRPVSIILPQLSHRTIDDQLNEISLNYTR